MPTKASNTNPTLVVALDEEAIQALAAALAEALKGNAASRPEPEEDEEDFEDEEKESDEADEDDGEDEQEGDEEPEVDDEAEDESVEETEDEDQETEDEDEEPEEDEEDDEGGEEDDEGGEEEESNDDYWTVDSLVALDRRALRRMARENGVEFDRDTEDADLAQAIIEAMNEQDQEE